MCKKHTQTLKTDRFSPDFVWNLSEFWVFLKSVKIKVLFVSAWLLTKSCFWTLPSKGEHTKTERVFISPHFCLEILPSKFLPSWLTFLGADNKMPPFFYLPPMVYLDFYRHFTYIFQLGLNRGEQTFSAENRRGGLYTELCWSGVRLMQNWNIWWVCVSCVRVRMCEKIKNSDRNESAGEFFLAGKRSAQYLPGDCNHCWYLSVSKGSNAVHIGGHPIRYSTSKTVGNKLICRSIWQTTDCFWAP